MLVSSYQPLTVTKDALPTRMTRDIKDKYTLNYRKTYLNLENLQCYEIVTDQFAQLGITFDNALAIEPSNPAYPPRSGKIVLMASPKNGLIEAKFKQSITYFNCYVTSSQRTTLSAYNHHHELVARIETAGSNLANSECVIPPNARLTVTGSGITRIIIESFDGQLVINDLSFALSH